MKHPDIYCLLGVGFEENLLKLFFNYCPVSGSVLPQENEIAQLERMVEIAHKLIEDIAVRILVLIVVSRVNHRTEHVVDGLV